jgi:hypothetical protein
MKEEPFRYGENNRCFGILTLPDDLDGAPIVVALNAGLLHRSEPYRLNVLVCRGLADAGYICARIDISGKGDSPPREGMSFRELVDMDWGFIRQSLVRRFGERNIILLGLCSGADNGIKLCVQDPLVKGLVLLDAVSPRDAGAARRDLMHKLANFRKVLNIPRAVLTRVLRRISGKPSDEAEQLMLRSLPTETDLRQCFEGIVERRGRVLAVFTSHAYPQYNQAGQFVRALAVNGLEECCEEEFWPTMMHLYPVEVHRAKLVQRINQWGRDHFARLKDSSAT